jgi:hypothetical protein
VPCSERGLRLAGINDHTASLLAMLEQVLRDAGRYDVLHFHVDFLHFPTFRHLAGQMPDDPARAPGPARFPARPSAPSRR